MNKTTSIPFYIFFFSFWLTMNPLLYSQTGFRQTPVSDSNFQNTKLAKFKAEKFIYDSFSLKRFCPKPRNQGKLKICIPMATAYSAGTILLAQRNNWTDRDEINEYALSPFFLYSKIVNPGPLECNTDLEFSEVFNAFKEGSCLYKDYSELKDANNPRIPCYDPIKNERKLEAQSYQLESYSALFKINQQNSDETIINLQRKLLEGKPIVVGLNLDQSYTKDVFKIVELEGITEEDGIGHAVTIIGYKRNEGTREISFQIMDSWGTNFRDEGFWWITGEELKKSLQYAYEINLKENTLLELVDPDNNFKLHSLPIGFNKSKYQYEIDKQKWMKDTLLFSTHCKHFSNNGYLYMLYYSPNEVPNYSYFEMGMTKGYLIDKDKNIFIPSKDKLDFITKDGDDYIIFLYSLQPIIDMNKYLKELNQCGNELIYTDLKKVFQNNLKLNINYLETRIGFRMPSNDNQNEKYIIPIIIKFKG